jgi:hypothetical protein
MRRVFIGALGAMLVATGVWNVDSPTRVIPLRRREASR